MDMFFHIIFNAVTFKLKEKEGANVSLSIAFAYGVCVNNLGHVQLQPESN